MVITCLRIEPAGTTSAGGPASFGSANIRRDHKNSGHFKSACLADGVAVYVLKQRGRGLRVSVPVPSELVPMRRLVFGTTHDGVGCGPNSPGTFVGFHAYR